MASDLILNGVTYSGTPVSGSNYKPVALKVDDRKIGVLHESRNGTQTFVYYGVKKVWHIRWERVPESTMTAVKSLHELTTSFTFVDQLGASWTCITTNDDLSWEVDKTLPSGFLLYNIDLTIRQV